MNAYDAIHSIITGREPPAERPDDDCDRCEGGGWVQVYSPSPPAFDVCPKCFNPKGHPSP